MLVVSGYPCPASKPQLPADQPQLVEAVLQDHPTLTLEEALRMLNEAGM
jgi:hypothetical protein